MNHEIFGTKCYSIVSSTLEVIIKNQIEFLYGIFICLLL